MWRAGRGGAGAWNRRQIAIDGAAVRECAPMRRARTRCAHWARLDRGRAHVTELTGCCAKARTGPATRWACDDDIFVRLERLDPCVQLDALFEAEDGEQPAGDELAGWPPRKRLAGATRTSTPPIGSRPGPGRDPQWQGHWGRPFPFLLLQGQCRAGHPPPPPPHRGLGRGCWPETATWPAPSRRRCATASATCCRPLGARSAGAARTRLLAMGRGDHRRWASASMKA